LIRPGLLGAQALGGADGLRDGLAVEASVVTRERAADVPEAAQLVERPAQLGLEHDDDRDDDEGRGVLEQPREKDQVELRGDHAGDRQQDEADEDLRTLGAAQQAQQLVEDEGDHRHVDHLDQAEVTDDLAELLEELLHYSPAPSSSVIKAICA